MEIKQRLQHKDSSTEVHSCQINLAALYCASLPMPLFLNCCFSTIYLAIYLDAELGEELQNHPGEHHIYHEHWNLYTKILVCFLAQKI